MLSWMQKHRKYLVITIWISTIAFIGAGFVGWGAYNFGNNLTNAIATVGHRTITNREFQQEYTTIYNYYNNLFNGKFSKEQAKSIGLENEVLQTLVQRALFLNFADDLGLRVDDEDIARYLVKDPNFQQNGVFSKKLYLQRLQSIGESPYSYETDLKKNILLKMLFSAITLDPRRQDLAMFNAVYFMQDRLSVDVITANFNQKSVDEKVLKDLWLKNKSNFLTHTVYKLQTKFIKPNDDISETVLKAFYEEHKNNYLDNNDTIMSFKNARSDVLKDYNLQENKRLALIEYLKVKKGQEKLGNKVSVSDDNTTFPIDVLEYVKKGETIKPFVYNGGYMIIHVDDIVLPHPKTFKEARADVMKIYEAQNIKNELENRSKELLKNFKGKDIGFVGKVSKSIINSLDNAQFTDFIMKVFENPNTQGYVILGNKAIVYKVLEQKLLNNTNNKDDESVVYKDAKSFINGELRQNLATTLLKYYKVQYYGRQ